MTVPSSDKHNETNNKLQEDDFESILKCVNVLPDMCSLLKNEFITWSEFEDCPSDDINSFIKRHNLHAINRTKLRYVKHKEVYENASMHDISNTDITFSELKIHVKIANDKI